MLTAIRERATGWIAWVIVILITIPFALWGINSYFQGGSVTATATVNGVDITNTAYQQALAGQRRALADRLGSDFDPALLDSPGIKRRVLDGLIDNQLLHQFTREQNFSIPDSQLTRLIQEFPEFQQDGRFSQELYVELLGANRLSPQGFEQSQRLNGMVNQLQAGINDSAFLTEMERDRLLVLQEQTRTVEYALLKADQYVDEFVISADQVHAYYDKYNEHYLTDARIKVDYIELSVESLSALIEPSEEEIAALYGDTKERYAQAESRRASHILISVGQSDSADEKREKRNLVNDILAQARDGGDFALLASLHSDDPGSKEKGGDLGIIAKGQMVKPFEDAVFAMREGEITGPVESQFGYHIIKLTGLSAGSQQPLEAVREQVEVEAKRIQAERQFAELAESFKNLAFEAPDNLKTIADELDLTIRLSDWFTAAQGSGVASDASVRRAAFAEDVLNENLVSPAIEIGFDKLVALQKSEYEPTQPKSVESVRDEIMAVVKAEKSRAKVLENGSDLLAELESMPPSKLSWQQFVAGQNLEVESFSGKKSAFPADLIMLADAAFALAAPAAGEVRFAGLVLNSGDYALISLEKVVQGDLADINDAQRTSVQQQLLARDGSVLFGQFLAFLRDNAEIIISQDQL